MHFFQNRLVSVFFREAKTRCISCKNWGICAICGVSVNRRYTFFNPRLAWCCFDAARALGCNACEDLHHAGQYSVRGPIKFDLDDETVEPLVSWVMQLGGGLKQGEWM